MHHIDMTLPPAGVHPAVHDADLREQITAACGEHGTVELRYPHSGPDYARLVDGRLVVTSGGRHAPNGHG